MATFNNLLRERGWNPYLLGGRKLEDMVFYDPSNGKILGNLGSGWLSVGGSNNDGNNVLEELKFRLRRKPFLDSPAPHYVTSTAYIPITSLPNFKFEPDSLHTTFADGEKNYGNHITFNCAATSNWASTIKHLSSVEPRRFILGRYTRTEYTGEAKRKRCLEQFFKMNNITISSYESAKLLKLSAEDKLELAELLSQ